MSDMNQEIESLVLRGIPQEISRLETDFDSTRNDRILIKDKLMGAVQQISLINADGTLTGDMGDKLEIIKTASKIMGDMEKANVQAVGIKIKNREVEVAAASNADDRIAAVLLAAKRGVIREAIADDVLDSMLDTMFEGQIKESETKLNPRDLDAP